MIEIITTILHLHIDFFLCLIKIVTPRDALNLFSYFEILSNNVLGTGRFFDYLVKMSSIYLLKVQYAPRVKIFIKSGGKNRMIQEGDTLVLGKLYFELIVQYIN